MKLYNFTLILILLYTVKIFYTALVIFCFLMGIHLDKKYYISSQNMTLLKYINIIKIKFTNIKPCNNIIVKAIYNTYNNINYYYQICCNEIIEMYYNLFIDCIKDRNIDNELIKILFQEFNKNINTKKPTNNRSLLNNLKMFNNINPEKINNLSNDEIFKLKDNISDLRDNLIKLKN